MQLILELFRSLLQLTALSLQPSGGLPKWLFLVLYLGYDSKTDVQQIKRYWTLCSVLYSLEMFADLWMEHFSCCWWHRHFVISLCIRKNFFLRNLSCSYNCLPLLLRLIVCLLLSGGEQLYSKGQSKFTWLPQAVGWLAIFWQYSSNSSCVIGSPLELVMNGK